MPAAHSLDPYNHLIDETAILYRLPRRLLAAQILVESAGDRYAFRHEAGYFDRYLRRNPSARGAGFGPLAACSYGLLQVMLETALEIGFAGRPEELFDPKTGLEWGARYLRACWDWAGATDPDYPRALSAYNGGKGAARVGPPFRNQPYVDKVYAHVPDLKRPSTH